MYWTKSHRKVTDKTNDIVMIAKKNQKNQGKLKINAIMSMSNLRKTSYFKSFSELHLRQPSIMACLEACFSLCNYLIWLQTSERTETRQSYTGDFSYRMIKSMRGLAQGIFFHFNVKNLSLQIVFFGVFYNTILNHNVSRSKCNQKGKEPPSPSIH